MNNVLFISIKPQYVARILDGSKTVELRKNMPSIKVGCMILLYSTSPVKKVVAICELEGVIDSTPNEIWSNLSDKLGINEKDYFDYYQNSKRAVALNLKNVTKFDESINLSQIRTKIPGFSPPQTYKYFKAMALKSLFENEYSEVLKKMHLT